MGTMAKTKRETYKFELTITAPEVMENGLPTAMQIEFLATSMPIILQSALRKNDKRITVEMKEIFGKS